MKKDQVRHRIIHFPYKIFEEKTWSHEIRKNFWIHKILIKSDQIRQELYSEICTREKNRSLSFLLIEKMEKPTTKSVRKIKTQVKPRILLNAQKLSTEPFMSPAIPSSDEIHGKNKDKKHMIIPKNPIFSPLLAYESLNFVARFQKYRNLLMLLENFEHLINMILYYKNLKMLWVLVYSQSFSSILLCKWYYNMRECKKLKKKIICEIVSLIFWVLE